jgi:hypothetical protein
MQDDFEHKRACGSRRPQNNLRLGLRVTKKKKHPTESRRVAPSNRALLDAFTERGLDAWATQSVDQQSYAEDIRPSALCH